MVRTLTSLREDETMLVQSGKPVGVMRTHEWAPRVLIANSNLVGDWATWPEFRRLEALGLTMYGQMTAGSWIYIGTQGILQGTYETFAAVAAKRFGGTLAGTLTVTGGCGGMGGAQPLAVTLNDGVCLVIDVDPARLARRVEHALPRRGGRRPRRRDRPLSRGARGDGAPLSVGLVGNCAVVLPELLRRGVPVDIVTDQTSAHDPLSYLPEGVDLADWHDYASAEAARNSPNGPGLRWPGTSSAMVGFLDAGAEVFDYGNSIRDEARLGGFGACLRVPRLRARLHPPAVRARARARSAGRRCPATRRTSTPPTRRCCRCSPTTRTCTGGSAPRRRRSRSRACPRASAGSATASATRRACGSTRWWPPASFSAPVVIGRDHLDCGSVASPYRETESMADGSDAIADWPLLNALVNTASGATWVSFHHGGGVGIGRSIHAGQVCVADGSRRWPRQKIERVLTNDPGMGVLRHIDSGDAPVDEVRWPPTRTAASASRRRRPLRGPARLAMAARLRRPASCCYHRTSDSAGDLTAVSGQIPSAKASSRGSGPLLAVIRVLCDATGGSGCDDGKLVIHAVKQAQQGRVQGWRRPRAALRRACRSQ